MPEAIYVLFVNGEKHSTHDSEWEARAAMNDCRGYWEKDSKPCTIVKYTIPETVVEE